MADAQAVETAAPTYTRKDFQSDQEVRWCPGCGDYTILASVQNFLAAQDVPREKYVFVSGIGCSSRFPYYLSTYGIHGIHGRAPALATGGGQPPPRQHPAGRGGPPRGGPPPPPGPGGGGGPVGVGPGGGGPGPTSTSGSSPATATPFRSAATTSSTPSAAT